MNRPIDQPDRERFVSELERNFSVVAAAGSPVAVGTHPTAVAVADFDGDHDLDIAVTNNSDNTVSISSGRPAIRCFSVSPSRNSMTMYG